MSKFSTLLAFSLFAIQAISFPQLNAVTPPPPPGPPSDTSVKLVNNAAHP
ncbi:hypothetical protein M422DRAFT_249442 [Sphaerobolus stellatus SS14]|uniref:Uncharacterized protein n=1 Tax=Sphaerobolus stellatus (strain SS14) TaxID=990650 RepID=A0A0C9W4H6_SPHS4|nr:hypothetical protein M422DRAFT_249440 [Sphaerobolus stellatus SS14]KIJ47132.1 hypothetical protein M422DRAFT_249442 [Sphaerobolus stellatus SS14]